MPAIATLLVGDFERAEFRAAKSVLATYTETTEFAALESAVLAIEAGYPAALIVVAQAFPGQFSHRAIERLRRAAPLARIVALLGTLCEGEQRSGLPWPATARVYWHQWPARCRRQLAALAHGKPCSWSLPVTSAEEERLLADASLDTSRDMMSGKGVVVVRSRRFESWDWLRAACRRRGLAAVWQRGEDAVRIDGVAAAVFDGGELDEGELQRLRRFAAAYRPAPTLVLLSFPRVEDRDGAISAGAAAVFSKPLVEAEIFAELMAQRR